LLSKLQFIEKWQLKQAEVVVVAEQVVVDAPGAPQYKKMTSSV